MIFLRILVVVLLAAVAYCALGYVFTRDRRYLRLAWRLLIAGLLAALGFFIVLIIERLTPESRAAASRLRPRARRAPRSRSATRSVSSPSFMADVLSAAAAISPVSTARAVFTGMAA